MNENSRIYVAGHRGLVGSAMEAFESVPLLKTLFAWLLFLGLLGFLFWYTR